ncbi:MAG: Uncharacterised protein [Polaribacter sejongensis]|nr:MAG: Uncharacterised protein [Polaribacter sejongensis]
MKTLFFCFKIVFAVSVFLISCQNSKRNLHPETLVGGFELLPAEQTGIDFMNSIKESENLNHIYYNQLYSGAGVAIGDLNNDGLADVFFCGNQVEDKLYLNKGNFKFEDISKKSKITRSPGWSWGVTMADVNNDGYLDIYVSRNGDSMTPSDRTNKLFINNKDLTFTESAKEYGLADAGFSSQAVFFDMDNDGDLDMYQVNQLPDGRLFSRYINIPEKRYQFYTDKLYINNDGFFQDISQQAGLSSKYTYGLSVSASDFNNDGFVDLYISNDYDAPDFMYQNNGDGTFKNVIDEQLKHISRFSMGTDTGDINNDGLVDIFTLDMAAEDHYRSKTNMGSMNAKEFNEMIESGGHHQYMSNTLQLNTGTKGFSDIAHLAGLAKTDWSSAGLLVDLDNDGFKDIIISNGIKKDVRNNDFLTSLSKELKTTSQDFYGMSKIAPSTPVANYVYKNTNGFEFKNVSEKWGFTSPSFSYGMAYGDLDNDGDLDVVVNNMEQHAFVYENKATGNFLKIKFEGSKKNKFGIGAKAIIHYNNKMQVAENNVTRGFLSSMEHGLFFGLGKEVIIEKVEVIWPDGKMNIFENIDANKTLLAKYANATLISKNTQVIQPLFSEIKTKDFGLGYKHKENEFDELEEETLLPHKLSNNGPFSAIADVNGDGLDDLFIGGAAKQEGVLYLQNNEGKFEKSEFQPWSKDKKSEDLGALFFDVDGDHDLDLYVTSGGSEFKRGDKLLKDRLYINDGLGGFTKNSKAIPTIYESTQCVKASDIDADGDLDLFVGTRLIAGKYPFPGSSYLLINDKGIFKKAATKIAPDLQEIGMVTDAVFSDIDADGDKDLLIVGEWMKIKVLENNKGLFKENAEKFGIDEDSRGLWWSITVNDLDNDGDDDYIIGNLGKNNKFKATKQHPFKVYANDFDNNGTNDVVLAKFYKNDYVPMRGRECTSLQMPYVAEKFKDYHSFASSKLIDILPEDKVKTGIVYEISNFESIILINDKGVLRRKPLPIEAQVSPIKSSLVDDFNADGFKDILLVGNHYGVEVETTRYDAGHGALLLGDGHHNFTSSPPSVSGFHVPFDSRTVLPITIHKKKALLINNNNDSLLLFSRNK